MMTLRHRRRNGTVRRRRAAGLTSGVLTGSFALLLGACARPTPAPSPAATTLRVMTYNIRSGNGNLAGTTAAIRALAPDVVALQEVDVHWAARSDFADQATALGRKLGMQVRFAPIYIIPDSAVPGRPPREFGVALLSRFPIALFRNDTLTRLSTQVQNPVPLRMPGLLIATLDVHGSPVFVLNTHLDYRRDPSIRAAQVREMLAHIDTTIPTLVFGDMNASPSAAELQPLLARLHDAWSAAGGPGFTYPADAPTERIDYILTSSHFRVRDARVPATAASDHRPVVADLQLVRPRQLPPTVTHRWRHGPAPHDLR